MRYTQDQKKEKYVVQFDGMNFENLEFLTKVAGKHGLKEAKHTYMQLQSLGFFTWKVRVKKKKIITSEDFKGNSLTGRQPGLCHGNNVK